MRKSIIVIGVTLVNELQVVLLTFYNDKFRLVVNCYFGGMRKYEHAASDV